MYPLKGEKHDKPLTLSFSDKSYSNKLFIKALLAISPIDIV